MAYSVFVSYCRTGGEGFAMMIGEKLSKNRFQVICDLESIEEGELPLQTVQEIQQANVFVAVLSAGAEKGWQSPSNWMRREIACALQFGKPIIALYMKGFALPDPLPDDIELLADSSRMDMQNIGAIDANMRSLGELIQKLAKTPPALSNDPTAKGIDDMITVMNTTLNGSAPAPDKTEKPQNKADNRTARAKRYYERAKKCGTRSLPFDLSVGFCHQLKQYYYLRAAELGHTEALMHFLGLARDRQSFYVKASKVEHAAAKGNARAQFLCGLWEAWQCRDARSAYDDNWNDQHVRSALQYLGDAAVQQYLPAQLALGNSYSSFEPPFANTTSTYSRKRWLDDTRDDRQAFFWYTRAAEQGSAYARRRVGIFYEEGKGVNKNYEKAAYHYRIAALQGDAEAQWRLGRCYEHGNGVEKNTDQAAILYSMAADQGHTEAQRNLVSLDY